MSGGGTEPPRSSILPAAAATAAGMPEYFHNTSRQLQSEASPTLHHASLKVRLAATAPCPSALLCFVIMEAGYHVIMEAGYHVIMSSHFAQDIPILVAIRSGFMQTNNRNVVVSQT